MRLVLLHPAGSGAVAGALLAGVRQRRPVLPVEAQEVRALDVGDPAVAGRLAPGTVAVALAPLPPHGAPAPADVVVTPLAGHPLLLAAAERRLREAGVWPGDPACGVVLAGADHVVAERAAREWARTGWHTVLPAVSGDRASMVAAVQDLRGRGAERVAVARLDLAGAPLPAPAPRVAVAAPLGACEEVVRAVLDRFDIAARRGADVAA